ncbi:hypothetical protein ABTO96_12510 [Acinetobacter baumannii]
MTDQNTDHAQLVAGDHNYSDSRWRESYLTRPYYQEAQLTTPDLDYDRDFSAAYELGHRARSESALLHKAVLKGFFSNLCTRQISQNPYPIRILPS